MSVPSEWHSAAAEGARWVMSSCLKELDQTPHFLCSGEKIQYHRTTERETITDSYSTKVCNDNQ